MRFYSSIYATIGLITLVLASQAHNRTISADYAEQFGCEAKCQKILEVTNKADDDIMGEFFDYDFYETVAWFKPNKHEPGTLLKAQTMPPGRLDVPAGTEIYRIQYVSRDEDKMSVPATAFIAIPPPQAPLLTKDDLDKQKKKVYRLAAYAHGTSGVYAGCAPSSGPTLYDYSTWKAAVARGYAVVGTDYAGLGNNFTEHKFLNFPLHANDIYYSVKAARAMFPRRFTDEWVSFGHSQGGGAVWKLAESDLVRDDKNYLGTVAIAPMTNFVSMTVKNHMRTKRFKGYLPFLITAGERNIPNFNPQFLSFRMRQRLEMAKDAQLCANAMFGLSRDLHGNNIVFRDILKDDRVKLLQWQALVAPAQQGSKLQGPIMIVQGYGDTYIRPRTTTKAARSSCTDGNYVHLRKYSKLGHISVVQAAAAEWLGFMDELFENTAYWGSDWYKKKKDRRGRCTTHFRIARLRPVKRPPMGGDELQQELQHMADAV